MEPPVAPPGGPENRPFRHDDRKQRSLSALSHAPILPPENGENTVKNRAKPGLIRCIIFDGPNNSGYVDLES
jgi:hypothetical protein